MSNSARLDHGAADLIAELAHRDAGPGESRVRQVPGRRLSARLERLRERREEVALDGCLRGRRKTVAREPRQQLGLVEKDQQRLPLLQRTHALSGEGQTVHERH